MAARKIIQTLAGTKRPSRNSSTGRSTVAVPVNSAHLADAIEQLQETVNELQVRFNAHQHSALNAAPSTNQVTGTAQADAGLFTP